MQRGRKQGEKKRIRDTTEATPRPEEEEVLHGRADVLEGPCP